MASNRSVFFECDNSDNQVERMVDDHNIHTNIASLLLDRASFRVVSICIYRKIAFDMSNNATVCSLYDYATDASQSLRHLETAFDTRNNDKRHFLRGTFRVESYR
jgi:hypothetical protein